MSNVFTETAIPENIIEFKPNGYDIKVDAMELNKPYVFRFDGSRYEIKRDKNDALVMSELLPLEFLDKTQYKLVKDANDKVVEIINLKNNKNILDQTYPNHL